MRYLSKSPILTYHTYIWYPVRGNSNSIGILLRFQASEKQCPCRFYFAYDFTGPIFTNARLLSAFHRTFSDKTRELSE